MMSTSSPTKRMPSLFTFSNAAFVVAPAAPPQIRCTHNAGSFIWIPFSFESFRPQPHTPGIVLPGSLGHWSPLHRFPENPGKHEHLPDFKHFLFRPHGPAGRFMGICMIRMCVRSSMSKYFAFEAILKLSCQLDY